MKFYSFVFNETHGVLGWDRYIGSVSAPNAIVAYEKIRNYLLTKSDNVVIPFDIDAYPDDRLILTEVSDNVECHLDCR